MASRSATVASRIRTGPGIAHGRRTFPFQRLDVPFHLQEDREERQDARVDVGAVARGARVLSRLVEQAIEHLAVLLPQRASIVHPVVQDRLEVQSIGRNRAAHSLWGLDACIRWDAGEGSVKVQCRRRAIRHALDPEEASRLLIEEYSRMAREYDTCVTPYHEPIARRLLELAHVKEGERILDIGCGTGIVAFEAAAAVGEAGSVVGIDLAERAVRLAADKTAALGLKHVHFEVMDSRALRFPVGSYDAALSIFGHPLIERRRFFEEVQRVVDGGGRFALCTWNPSKAQSKGASILVREMLERRRPAVVAPDLARLIEARKVLASTEEGKETQSADGWIRLFRDAGLSSVETIEETHWATFRGPEAYLDYSFAWGDNERELRKMTVEDRESFRREFRERVSPMVTDEGLVVDWNLRYFLVR